MGFFQDLKEDLSQAVNDMLPDEEGFRGRKGIFAGFQQEEDLAEIEAIFGMRMQEEEKEREGKKLESLPSFEQTRKEEAVLFEGRESVLEVSPQQIETARITEGTAITGDIASRGSLELLGTVKGSVFAAQKLIIEGTLEGTSQAGEIYTDGARIVGDIRSEGMVNIGPGSIVVGNIVAAGVVIAGSVKGDIDVQGSVILETSAVIMGDVRSRTFRINDGAVIKGVCSQCYAQVDIDSIFEGIG